MSRHFRVNGKLLNTDKCWTDLKQPQKEWISQVLTEEYLSFILKNSRKPTAVESERILGTVYNIIINKEIWVPIEEVRIRWNQIKDKANRAVPNK